MAGLRRAVSTVRVRPWLIGASIALVSLWHVTARAQSCHAPVLVAPRAQGLRGAVEMSAASFDTSRYRGEYQVVAGTLAYARGPVLLYGRLPWSRITRNGVTYRGLGDASAAVRLRVLADEKDELRTGVALAGSLPTGDEASDLGMGHVMVTPGAYVAFQQATYTGELLVSYGRAVGHGGAHRHGARGQAPIVSPMNQSEIQSAIALVKQVHPLVSIVVGAFAAVPVAVKDGSPRAFTNGGVRVGHGWLDATLEIALPLAGDPFTLRLALGLGASF